VLLLKIRNSLQDIRYDLGREPYFNMFLRLPPMHTESAAGDFVKIKGRRDGKLFFK
jgi:hypothetical protein